MANENKPAVTIEQLLEVLAKHSAGLESGSASNRKTELMQKSMTSGVSKEENEELTRIMMNETGLGVQMARVFATDALQKSLSGAAGQALQPAFEEVQKSNQKAAEITATAVSNLQSELHRFSLPMGQTQVLQSRLMVEQNTLLKSLITAVETLSKQPAGPVKGFTGFQPAVVPVPQHVQQPGTQVVPQGQLGNGQPPAGAERLSKSVMTDHLLAMYQEASSGVTLPYNLNHAHIRDAMAHVDLDRPLQPQVVQAVVDRINKTK